MIEQILQDWRDETLPKHCAECGGQCCARDLQNLTRQQVLLLSENNPGMLNPNGRPLFVIMDGKWRTQYTHKDDRCPQLRPDATCGIYHDPNKPQTCNKFPIFLYPELSIVKIDPLCPATQDPTQLTDLAKQIRAQGFHVYYGRLPLEPEQT